MLKKLIKTRHKTHGPWTEVSKMAQVLKDLFRSTLNWNILSPSQREALEMLATKLSRILMGSPSHQDHWKDVSGYAELGNVIPAKTSRAPSKKIRKRKKHSKPGARDPKTG